MILCLFFITGSLLLCAIQFCLVFILNSEILLNSLRTPRELFGKRSDRESFVSASLIFMLYFLWLPHCTSFDFQHFIEEDC